LSARPFPTIQIQPVASGFASPVTVTNAGDGNGRLFIVEQFGRIQIVVNGTVLPIPFLDIHEVVSCCGEQVYSDSPFTPITPTMDFSMSIARMLPATLPSLDKRLDSLPLFLFPTGFSLTFRHNFNLEASSEDPNLGFDGGVLEISTDGGNTFQDILAAGGSFVMGGYNRTISTVRGSPIAGRQAWSGNSEGFITTVVNLPFIFAGNSRLRWRMASDTSGSSEGWRVDTVNIAGCVPKPCPSPTPTATPTPTASSTPTATPTATATATPTITPRPTPTARPKVTPRSRPTPAPRPTP